MIEVHSDLIKEFKPESFQDIRIRVNEAVEKKVRKVLDKS